MKKFCSLHNGLDKEKDNQLNIKDIPILKYFKYIFLEEIPGLPLKIDIDFTIDLVPVEVSTSKDPYWMNIVDLTKLKSQIQELIDKNTFDLVFPLGSTGFICKEKK